MQKENRQGKTTGKGIEPRFYRQTMNQGRLQSFVVGYKDSDLWIGIDPGSYNSSIPEFARAELVKLRMQLEDYILENPCFAVSFTPVIPQTGSPELVDQMCCAAGKAGTGPMAAVAGVFSEYLGKKILEKFDIKELVVENGGDIFLKLQSNMVIAVYAGNSPLSGKIGIEIPAADTPMGICTSAGTVGPSVSFGKADAVMVACRSTALADALATAIGNKVCSAADIDLQLATIDDYHEIYSLLIICDGKVGIKGKYELKLVR